MRKGKIISTKAEIITPLELIFETMEKKVIKVTSIHGGTIYGLTLDNQPCKVQKHYAVKLSIVDVISEEVFCIEESQQSYLSDFISDEFYFFNKPKSLEVMVLSKDPSMFDTMQMIEPIANAYGQYTASCKYDGNPALDFQGWYSKNGI